jgi:hypothetical protein
MYRHPEDDERAAAQHHDARRRQSQSMSESALSPASRRDQNRPGALTPGGREVPKHRRSEVEPSLAWLGAPADDDEFWPEAVGYGQAAGPARARPVGNRYPAPDDDGPDSWQEWQRQPWNDWVPPPELHPDHPSAPVPRILLPADHPSGPMPAARPPGAPGLPQRRPGRPGTGPDNGNRRLYVVPNDEPPADRRPAPAPRTREDPRRQFQAQPAADHYWPETIDYHSQARPLQAEPPPPAGQFQTEQQFQAQQFQAEQFQAEQFQDDGPSITDSLWTAGQVLTLADGQAAQIKQEARDYAAAVREAAEREAAAIADQAAAMAEQAAGQAAAITDRANGQAAAIREAMEREAARRRAELDSMSDELRRMAAYITENLVAPATPGTAPAMPFTAPPMPATVPAPPSTRPARPATRSAPSAPPGTRPARPETQPGTRPARPETQPRPRPAKPDTQPGTRPATAPEKKPQKQPRQLKAMKVATAATAALLSVALISGAAEVGMHGFKFFVFRAGGTGETAGTETDQQFLARQAAATHHVAAPKGRHHKKSHQTAEVHH